MGAALGTRSFTEMYVTTKVKEWTEEICKLSSFALTQPHAAYAAFVHGLIGKWAYLARSVPYISNLFLPLEHVIRHHFLPALTGRQNINDQERELLSLPARLGGIGSINPCKMTDHQFDISTQVTYPLTTTILQQIHEHSLETICEQQQIRKEVKRFYQQQQRNDAATLVTELPGPLSWAMEFASEVHRAGCLHFR